MLTTSPSAPDTSGTPTDPEECAARLMSSVLRELRGVHDMVAVGESVRAWCRHSGFKQPPKNATPSNGTTRQNETKRQARSALPPHATHKRMLGRESMSMLGNTARAGDCLGGPQRWQAHRKDLEWVGYRQPLLALPSSVGASGAVTPILV